MRRRYKRAAGCLLLAAALAAGQATAAFALPEEQPGGAYSEAYARLQDNRMEYDELEDLIKTYYEPITSGLEAATGTYTKDMADLTGLMFEAAREAKQDAKDLQDRVDAGEVPASELQETMTQIMTLRATATAYRAGERTMDRQIEYAIRPGGSATKAIQRSVNALVYNMQKAMNGYQQLMASREAAAKAVEVAETAQKMADLMRSQGQAVSADILSAASNLASARTQLESLDASADSLKKTLARCTGWGENGDPQIGAVPAADPAAIDAIDVAADQEKAVGNSYTLISLRGSSAGNMDQIEQALTKTTTQKRNRAETIAYSEDTVRSDVRTLYDALLENRSAYNAAQTAFRAGQMAWDAAQIQYRNGSLSELQLKQQELAYLQAKAAFTGADLALQQAQQNYNWAVRGVAVSAD